MTRLTVRARAKLNLGLEITGRRSDGYHNLVTIFQAVSIYDELTMVPATGLRLSVSGASLGGADNLAFAAMRRLRERARVGGGAAVHLAKGIPVAAGLGGASSDAAAALLAARQLWGAPVGDATLRDLAAALGSDVPFFLRGGTAFATGRGERIEPLPPLLPVWFVVVVPAVRIHRKTATLYAALTAPDFTAGHRVREQSDRLRAGLPLDPELLVNAFARPLVALRPELSAIGDAMRRVGAPVVALSGAGPSHFTVTGDERDAWRMARELTRLLQSRARVGVCQPVSKPPGVYSA